LDSNDVGLSTPISTGRASMAGADKMSVRHVMRPISVSGKTACQRRKRRR